MARRPSKRVPRYREIAEILRVELADGQYALGSIFPRELDLCDRFGVSRFTVRNAMAELEAAGMVERRKAIGTIVTALEPESAYVQSLSSAEEILQYPVTTLLSPREMVELKADTDLADWFGVAEGDPLVRIGGMRADRQNGQSICWTDIYVRMEHAELLDHIGKDERPVYKVIEDIFGERTRKVEVELSPATVTGDRARQLGVAEGSPALRILRVYTGSDGRVFEVSVSDHPQGRYTYKLEFSYETRGDQGQHQTVRG